MSADRYAVFGNPVAHSLSPEIHARFAAQCGHRMTYERIEARLDGFAEAAQRFLSEGGLGFNVTVPFKGDACGFVSHLDGLAREAHAVNTVTLRDDHTYGYNTDGIGLVRDLPG